MQQSQPFIDEPWINFQPKSIGILFEIAMNVCAEVFYKGTLVWEVNETNKVKLEFLPSSLVREGLLLVDTKYEFYNLTDLGRQLRTWLLSTSELDQRLSEVWGMTIEEIEEFHAIKARFQI